MDLQGPVQYREKAQNSSEVSPWSTARKAEALVAPVNIKTGDGARLTLQRQGDIITIGSNSVIQIPAEKIEEGNALIRVIQSLGNALFQIEKKSASSLKSRQFEVETPYLVSVVKGTTFSIQVDNTQAVVNLIEGRLQVNAININDSVILTSGQIAVMSENDTNIKVLDSDTYIELPIDNSTVNIDIDTTSINETSSHLDADETFIKNIIENNAPTLDKAVSAANQVLSVDNNYLSDPLLALDHVNSAVERVSSTVNQTTSTATTTITAPLNSTLDFDTGLTAESIINTIDITESINISNTTGTTADIGTTIDTTIDTTSTIIDTGSGIIGVGLKQNAK